MARIKRARGEWILIPVVSSSPGDPYLLAPGCPFPVLSGITMAVGGAEAALVPESRTYEELTPGCHRYGSPSQKPTSPSIHFR